METAKLFAGRHTPVYAIGLGTHLRPRDVAIIKVSAPSSVFFEDRLRGEIVLKDDLPAGQPFTIAIFDGETRVWETKLLSENKPVRRVPFDLNVKPLAERRAEPAAGTAGAAERSGFPLELKVSDRAG